MHESIPKWVHFTKPLHNYFFEVVMDDPLSFPRLSALDYQAMVVQRLDNAIHEMSCYPVDKC